MTIVSKVIYRFSAILIKTPKILITEVGKNNPETTIKP